MVENPKILITSLGSIGRRHLRNTRQLLPKAEIAVFRQKFTSETACPDGADILLLDYESALNFQPDAVIVASPASEHAHVAVPFVERGVAVFLEKPLCASLSEADRLRVAQRKSGSFVMVGYVLRFLPALHAIQRLIRENILGELRTAHVEVGQYLPDWRPGTDYRQGVSARKDLGGGALLELSHEIDYALWLFGLPSAVQCSCSRLSDLEIDVEDSAVAILEYSINQRGGRRVVIQLDFLQRVANMQMEIVGSKATLQANLIEEQLRLCTPEEPKGIPVPVDGLQSGNEIYLRQFDFFFSKALPSYVPIYDLSRGFDGWSDIPSAYRVLKLVELSKQASESGCRVVVESWDA